ncbi:MAG: GntR family transcriptional regulator, partial [Glaciihabitans sp.]|nr:GntR family transcriptional regulator [Glaciihabitans sp.]
GEPVSSQLTLACRTEGLILAAGPRFGIDGAFERFMRVPFSYSIEEIDRAVGAMERAWRAVGRHPITDTGYLAAVV